MDLPLLEQALLSLLAALSLALFLKAIPGPLERLDRLLWDNASLLAGVLLLYFLLLPIHPLLLLARLLRLFQALLVLVVSLNMALRLSSDLVFKLVQAVLLLSTYTFFLGGLLSKSLADYPCTSLYYLLLSAMTAVLVAGSLFCGVMALEELGDSPQDAQALLLQDPSLDLQQVLHRLAQPPPDAARKAFEVKVLVASEFISGVVLFLGDLYAHRVSGSDEECRALYHVGEGRPGGVNLVLLVGKVATLLLPLWVVYFVYYFNQPTPKASPQNDSFRESVFHDGRSDLTQD